MKIITVCEKSAKNETGRWYFRKLTERPTNKIIFAAQNNGGVHNFLDVCMFNDHYVRANYIKYH